ncbi:MAG: sulfurtransferase [Vicinamibacterales bacterium]
MTHGTLIGTAALAELLADPAVVIVDCRFELADTEAGERAYVESHIPGAVYAHLDRDLSGAKTGLNGRHPLPDTGALVATLGRLGIAPDTQVVAYDQDSGMWASRLWWLLKWMGHDAVAVLDGGFAAWTREGRPTTSAVTHRPARVFRGSARTELTINAEALPDFVSAAGSHLVDARAPERYRGDVEPLDPVAGHIPGAVNHFYQWNLADGAFLAPADLRARFEQSVGSISGTDVVCYCGSGVTACHNLLALEHAGILGARLYPGSWSEWVASGLRAVERG